MRMTYILNAGKVPTPRRNASVKPAAVRNSIFLPPRLAFWRQEARTHRIPPKRGRAAPSCGNGGILVSSLTPRKKQIVIAAGDYYGIYSCPHVTRLLGRRGQRARLAVTRRLADVSHGRMLCRTVSKPHMLKCRRRTCTIILTLEYREPPPAPRLVGSPHLRYGMAQALKV